jgi:uncharacterized lipoprotein YddW (UPF0748 family)
MQKLTIALICIFFIARCVAQPKPEFRGVWIATVDNIDWPTRGNYNSDSQKVEFTRILDMHQRNGMNAVIAQIRPATDAFYPSPYEPWSEWLTGKQGSPPNPYYDPLQFMIDETHKRGMVFHAWCNPYRAVFTLNKSSIAPTHVTRLHPEWFLNYGDKKYFDPGNKEAQQFVVSVIRDIVSRYNIDAIHFDDYFYPYRIAGKEFPDDSSFSKYNNGLSKDDWRRSNVDSIIVFLSRVIKEENKQCQFGISPFGIWRNKSQDPDGSETQGGQTNYDDLYADILLWLKKGWIDYVAPQIYFELGHPRAEYKTLLDWWSTHSYGKHCYIGLGIYKANTNAAWKDKTQIPRQIEALRNTANVQGMIFFSSKSFNNNPNGWSDSLRLNYFKEPASIPAMEWLANKPEKPTVELAFASHYAEAIGYDLKDNNGLGGATNFIVYKYLRDSENNIIESSKTIYKVIPAIKGENKLIVPYFPDGNLVYAVSVENKKKLESEMVFISGR